MEKVKEFNSNNQSGRVQNNMLGDFPHDWIKSKLSDIGRVSSGITPLRSNSEYFGEGVFWVKTTDLNNSYITETEEKITQFALQETSIKIVEQNSILVAMYGGYNQIGRTGLMKVRGTTNQAISSIPVDEKEFHSKFILHWLNFFRIHWRRFASSSRKDPNITKKDVENFPIMKPPYGEQQKIASILSTWDKAIELNEKLIEQKKEQKKGLMQKLLTGEMRLPGFDGEWKVVKLGDLLKERIEVGYNKLELLAITSNKGIVKRTEVDIKDNSSSDKSRYKRILPNDIGYNTMRMWQGVSGMSQYEGIVSPAYTVLKPTNKADTLFISYLFKVPKIIDFFRRFSQGLVSDTLNLKYNNFKKIKVITPVEINEQKRIAKILFTQDTEIEALKKKRDLLLEQKKGLMQLLLTGKVRVKV